MGGGGTGGEGGGEVSTLADRGDPKRNEGGGEGKSRREAIRNASISSNLGGIDQFNFVTNSCYNPLLARPDSRSGARTPPIG